MSRRASWSVVVVCLKKTSPERGCSWGSIVVSQPAFLRHDASRLRTSLCRRIGSPPYRQLRACSMSIAAPQTHVVGRCGTGQPYRRQRASRNAPLGSSKPWAERGSVVIQLEAPFSLASARACCSFSGSCWCNSATALWASRRASWWILDFDLGSGTPPSGMATFSVSFWIKLDVSDMEARCCRLAACGGLAMPKPPCRAGSASKSLYYYYYSYYYYYYYYYYYCYYYSFGQRPHLKEIESDITTPLESLITETTTKLQPN